MSYEIAVIPGDGIGPTVTHAVEPLFRDLAAEYGFEFTTMEYDWGTERYLDTGAMMPDDGVDQLEGTIRSCWVQSATRTYATTSRCTAFSFPSGRNSTRRSASGPRCFLKVSRVRSGATPVVTSTS